MKVLASDQVPFESRKYGRKVKRIFDEEIDNTSCVIYLSMLEGQLDYHYHKSSHEIIIFPEGGCLEVNGKLHQFGPYGAVLLEPGDVHGLSASEAQKQTHIAIKIPRDNDKVESCPSCEKKL